MIGRRNQNIKLQERRRKIMKFTCNPEFKYMQEEKMEPCYLYEEEKQKHITTSSLNLVQETRRKETNTGKENSVGYVNETYKLWNIQVKRLQRGETPKSVLQLLPKNEGMMNERSVEI